MPSSAAVEAAASAVETAASAVETAATVEAATTVTSGKGWGCPGDAQDHCSYNPGSTEKAHNNLHLQ